MHWEKLPQVVHNEDAVREYEQEESKQIAKSLKRAAWIILPIVLVLCWLLWR